VRLALVPHGDSAVVAEPHDNGVTSNLEDDAFDALVRIAGDEGVTSRQWELACGGRKVAFLEAKKALLQGRRVDNVGTPSRPRWIVATPEW
jgi:hypothetical protein